MSRYLVMSTLLQGYYYRQCEIFCRYMCACDMYSVCSSIISCAKNYIGVVESNEIMEDKIKPTR